MAPIGAGAASVWSGALSVGVGAMSVVDGTVVAGTGTIVAVSSVSWLHPDSGNSKQRAMASILFKTWSSWLYFCVQYTKQLGT